MRSYKKPIPLISIKGIKDYINTNPDFQRPAVWSKAQKQMLIDTILRNYDVPKLYWRVIDPKPKYDVVDGQQRLRAIWEFFDDGFKLPKDADSIGNTEIKNCCYSELPLDLRLAFDSYAFDIVILENTDEDEVREMFLRLQNGTSLKAQEKRNAFPGTMRDVVKEISKHQFFTKVGFTNSRYTYDLVAAQLLCMELAGRPVNIKNSDLNKMYGSNKDFNPTCAEAKSVIRILNFLNNIFPDKTPELERHSVISLYCVVSELFRQYVVEEIKPEMHDWFIKFEESRRANTEKSEDEIDSEWVGYKEKISHSTDAEDSIKSRMEFMLRHLLEQYPNLSLKDNSRNFTQSQRLAVFRRDKGHCQVKIKCGGDKLLWDGWHCDHIIPWSKGGKTIVSNAQAACQECNLSKGKESLDG